MSKELEKPQNDLRSILSSDKFKEQIALALPSHCTADRFARVALTAINKTPKLLDCTRESVLSCMMTCSQFGIEPDGRLAHLIPFGKECTIIFDYKSLIALAKRSGQVKSWRADKVCENDKFTYVNGVVSHEIDFRNPRGKAYCFYSDVTLNDGSHDYEVMHMDEIEFIRSKSRSGTSGPWREWFDEMAKKSCIRRHSKRLTLSPEFHDALEKDGDKLDERNMRNVTPGNVGTVYDPFKPLEQPKPEEPPALELESQAVNDDIKAWQEYYPSGWQEHVPSPSDHKALGKAHKADPDSPVLNAWLASWIMQTIPSVDQLSWDEIQEAVPGLPDAIEDCTPALLQAASKFVLKARESQAK